MNETERIEQQVLERLKRGDIRMRSRAYFAMRTVFVAVLALIILALSAYILSFIPFALHESGEQFLLGFGGAGIQTFFVLFPWVPAIVDVLLIILLEFMLQRFKFGYRIPLLVLFLGIFLVSGVLAVGIGATPVQGHLLDMADRGQLPLIGPAYESIRDPHEQQGIFRGTITAINGNGVSISHDDGDHDADDGTRQVMLPSGIATSSFSIGERVFVFGTPHGPVVQADGMQQLSPDQ